MKKIIIAISIFILICLLLNNNYDLTNDAIRFRVIANSNSSKDVIMKEKVVNEISGIIFKNNNSIIKTIDNIISNLENI